MGFLSGFFSGSSSSTQESSGEQSTTQESQSTQTGTQTGATTQTGTQRSTGTTTQRQQDVVSQLGASEQKILSDLIAKLAGQQPGSLPALGSGKIAAPIVTPEIGLFANDVPGATTDPAVLGALSERALGFNEQRERIQADLRAAATQRFQDTTGRAVKQEQQKIGASGEFNSAARLLDLDADRKLGVDLAGLSAQTDLELNQQEEAALLAALSGSGIAGATAQAASSAPLNELLQALSVSRGSQVISERTGEEQRSELSESEQQTNQLIETLQELISSASSNTKSSGTVTTTGTSQAPILGQIISAFKASSFGAKSPSIKPIS